MQISDTGINWVQNGDAIDETTLNKTAVSLLQKLGDLSLLNTLDGSLINNSSVPSGKLAQNSVETANLVFQSVTTDKIQDNNITEDKLQNSQVTQNKINDGAVLTNKIQLEAVKESQIGQNAITTQKIKDSEVTLQKLQNISQLSIIGNQYGIDSSPQAIQLSSLGQLMNLGSQSLLNAEQEPGDALKVSDFNLGVKETEDVTVLLFDNEIDFLQYQDDIDNEIIPEPDFKYSYGQIKDLPSGFYSLAQSHQENPLFGLPEVQDGSLIVTMNKDNLSNFIFQPTGILGNPEPRIFIQNAYGSQSSINWVELINKTTFDALEARVQALE